ncbi:MAG: DUF2065 domain-containing protein [Nevskiales bacterium]|nr:DUF2065 domain-containing protein [Nevskiales bacterium]
MAWQDLARAFALMLVLEGLWPFLSPPRWRTVIQRVSLLEDRALRTFGLVCMVGGLLVLQLV